MSTDAVTCPLCGNSMAITERFCPKCGSINVRSPHSATVAAEGWLAAPSANSSSPVAKPASLEPQAATSVAAPPVTERATLGEPENGRTETLPDDGGEEAPSSFDFMEQSESWQFAGGEDDGAQEPTASEEEELYRERERLVSVVRQARDEAAGAALPEVQSRQRSRRVSAQRAAELRNMVAYQPPASSTDAQSARGGLASTVFRIELIGYIGMLGIGHMYAGRAGRGLVLMLTWWFLLVSTFTGNSCIPGALLIFVPLASAMWISNEVYTKGMRYGRGSGLGR